MPFYCVQLCPVLIRLLRSERSFPVLLRLFRLAVSFILSLGQFIPTECEILINLLVTMVESGAAVVDCQEQSATSKSRFGSAGARIVAGAHRALSEQSAGKREAVRGAVEAKASGLAGTDWMDDDDSALSFTRALSLPKLVLALETWHVLTLRPDIVRVIFMKFDAPGQKVRPLGLSLSGRVFDVRVRCTPNSCFALASSVPRRVPYGVGVTVT